MENPKVSVIIPVYNVEKFLQRCIDSLLAQTYPNLEFIFVDDGSADASYSILMEAACQDNRICVYRQKNAGVSSARNTGITHSTGKYIMFCDSDDTVVPQWCETMVHAIQQNPYSWVVCGINVLSEHGNLLQTYSHSGGGLDIDEYYTLFITGLSGFVYNKIYSSAFIRNHDIWFDESYRRGEDVEFNLRYLDFCKGIYVVADNLYNYYRYTLCETLTNTYHEDDFLVQTVMYKIRKPYIADRYWHEFQLHYWRVLYLETERTMNTPTIPSLSRKLKQNSMNIRTKEYNELLNGVGCEETPAWQVSILKTGQYSLFWIVMKIAAVKERIFTYIERRRYE